LDAVFEDDVRIAEGAPLLGFRAAHGGGIGDAPMGGHRIARPYRAQLARRLVADCEHEIHHRRPRFRELPAFAAQPVLVSMCAFSSRSIASGCPAPFGKLPAL